MRPGRQGTLAKARDGARPARPRGEQVRSHLRKPRKKDTHQLRRVPVMLLSRQPQNRRCFRDDRARAGWRQIQPARRRGGLLARLGRLRHASASARVSSRRQGRSPTSGGKNSDGTTSLNAWVEDEDPYPWRQVFQPVEPLYPPQKKQVPLAPRCIQRDCKRCVDRHPLGPGRFSRAASAVSILKRHTCKSQTLVRRRGWRAALLDQTVDGGDHDKCEQRRRQHPADHRHGDALHDL